MWLPANNIDVAAQAKATSWLYENGRCRQRRSLLEMEHRPATVENYMSLIYEQKGQRDEAVKHDLLALRADTPEIGRASERREPSKESPHRHCGAA